MWKKYKASQETLERANREFMDKVLRNSIRAGKGNFVARLGEILAQKVIGGSMENTFDYDLISPLGMKIDVKTKERTVAPLPHYEVSVADFNTKQECDAYLFTSILVSKEEAFGWLVGWMTKKDFYDKAKFHKKGELDPSNNFIFKADCYNMRMDLLRQDFDAL